MDITLLTDSLLNLVLVIISIAISSYLVPWLKQKYTAEKVNNVYDIVKKAVEAAEKIYSESGMGPIRKDYVVKYLKDKGINISEADLNILIESAVKTLDLLEKEIKKPE